MIQYDVLCTSDADIRIAKDMSTAATVMSPRASWDFAQQPTIAQSPQPLQQYLSSPAAMLVQQTRTPGAKSASKSSANARTPGIRHPLPSVGIPQASTTPQEARTASPNYFGLIVESSNDRDTAGGQHSKANWQSPSSSIRSIAAPSPKPVEANEQFEAFRRQTEAAQSFRLGRSNFSGDWMEKVKNSDDMDTSGDSLKPLNMRPPPTPGVNLKAGTPVRPPSVLMNIDTPVKQDQKSPFAEPEQYFTPPRNESPASFGTFVPPNNGPNTAFPQGPSDLSRLSLPEGRLSTPTNGSRSPKIAAPQRSSTLPSRSQNGEPLLISAESLSELLASSKSILLLDVRPFPQYQVARIPGALTLCIPTTLLKRPSFGTQKCAETFSNPSNRGKFDTWKECEYIIAYDSSSRSLKDGATAVHTLTKFTREGWTGTAFVVSGGFNEFAKSLPGEVDRSADGDYRLTGARNLKLETTGAPVVGGCAMPDTKNAANPFFNTIRQNIDLLDGVGQYPVALPKALNSDLSQQLPEWMKQAADPKDEGKLVSDRFLALEQGELKTMRDALSVKAWEKSNTGDQCTQIAGIEKGQKNRYKNIWPFDHSRVVLQSPPAGACDYVNASHIKSSLSNKRYIATQGPLPATMQVSRQYSPLNVQYANRSNRIFGLSYGSKTFESS
jgi:tyrosine-protein phosphatase 2/3